MKDFTKSSGAKSAVRQKRGPGMNLGLKKPRKNFIPEPKPYVQPRALKAATKVGKASSYLSDLDGAGSVQAMKSGKGKSSLANKTLRSKSW